MSPRKSPYNTAPTLPSPPVGNQAAAAMYPPSAAAKYPPSGKTKEELSDWEHDWNAYQEQVVVPEGCNDWADVPDLDDDIIYPSDDITEPSFSSTFFSPFAGSTSKNHGHKKQGPPLESSTPKKKIKVEPGTTAQGVSTQLLFRACDGFYETKGPPSAVSAGSKTTGSQKTMCGPPELVDLSASKSSSFDSDIDDEISKIDLKKSVAANALRKSKQDGSKVVVETQRRGQSHSFNLKDLQKSDDSSVESGDDDSSSASYHSTTSEDSYNPNDSFIKNSSESDSEVSDDSSDEESLSDESSSSSDSSSSDSSDSS